MITRYERTVARRYLWPGKGEGIIAIVASFSLLGVTLGVAALVIVMSVMNGFRAELFDKITALNGHAVIQGYDGRLPDWRRIAAAAKATPGVVSATPLIEQPLMSSAGGRVEGALVRGMEQADLLGPSIGGKVIVGNIAEVTPGSGNIAIGARLAEALGASVGRQISLISPAGQSTPFGTVPRIVAYRVAAIFEVGVYDYDNAFVVMPMSDAQTLLMMGDAVGMIEVQTVDPDKVGTILAPLVPKVRGDAEIKDWRQMNASLFEALEIERVMMFIVLSIIIIVAAFNIPLLAGDAGPRQDARHRHPAHDGGHARRADPHLRDRRPHDRRAGDVERAGAGGDLPVLPPGCRERRPVSDRAESMGSLDPLPHQAAGAHRSVRSDRDRGYDDAARLALHALSRLPRGEDRSGTGIAL
jgi:ABC-type lipoprotein release transport system permease subunit